ncbi:hypothetical protein MITS9504_02336 [Synechococcus sp. MIT S9504]|nr:hypothetical protein MITS9504_02336 [Synechococcus sp. MIT S9504]
MQDCGYVDIIFLTIPLEQRMSIFAYKVVFGVLRTSRRLVCLSKWVRFTGFQCWLRSPEKKKTFCALCFGIVLGFMSLLRQITY